MLSLPQIAVLSSDSAGKTKTRAWVSKLYKMNAAQELTEDEARQLSFDLEFGYNEFMATLHSN